MPFYKQANNLHRAHYNTKTQGLTNGDWKHCTLAPFTLLFWWAQAYLHLCFRGRLGRCSEISHLRKFTNLLNKTPTNSLTESYNKVNGNIRSEMGNKYFMTASSMISLEKKTLGSESHAVLLLLSVVLPHKCVCMWWGMFFICKCVSVLVLSTAWRRLVLVYPLSIKYFANHILILFYCPVRSTLPTWAEPKQTKNTLWLTSVMHLTWGTPSQSSACCMASLAFCTGWFGSHSAQSGHKPSRM